MLTLFLEILLNGIILVHKPCIDFFIYIIQIERWNQKPEFCKISAKKNTDGEDKRSETRPFHFFPLNFNAIPG